MALISVTKAEARINWEGKEVIDENKKGKKLLINSKDFISAKEWSGGSRISFADGTVMAVKEPIDELSKVNSNSISISVTKLETRINWKGKEVIDENKKGKKLLINTEDVRRVERWSIGTKIFFADGSAMVVKESLGELAAGGNSNTTSSNQSLASPQIFISYRRNDSIHISQTIYDYLTESFDEGAIYFDIDTMPIGVNFKVHINEYIDKCSLLIVVIGRYWLDERDENGNRRLDNPNDFVRLEIERALHNKIKIVPVLVDETEIPKAEHLPKSIRPLLDWNACKILPGKERKKHLRNFVKQVKDILDTD